MKPKNIVSAILGIGLIVLAVCFGLQKRTVFFVPGMIGISLVYLGYRPGRIAVLVFGHIFVIVGCFLVTWGIYLLPSSQPKLSHIFGRPLFWGLFSIFGGVCAIYHGFCRCVSKCDSAGEAPRL
jgi:hypothetical protein